MFAPELAQPNSAWHKNSLSVQVMIVLPTIFTCLAFRREKSGFVETERFRFSFFWFWHVRFFFRKKALLFRGKSASFFPAFFWFWHPPFATRTIFRVRSMMGVSTVFSKKTLDLGIQRITDRTERSQPSSRVLKYIGFGHNEKWAFCSFFWLEKVSRRRSPYKSLTSRWTLANTSLESISNHDWYDFLHTSTGRIRKRSLENSNPELRCQWKNHWLWEIRITKNLVKEKRPLKYLLPKMARWGDEEFVDDGRKNYGTVDSIILSAISASDCNQNRRGTRYNASISS